MLIRIEDEGDVKALERVRHRHGDRSARAAVSRLIREADSPAPRRCKMRTPIGICGLYTLHGSSLCSGHDAMDEIGSTSKRRKGAR